MSEKVDELNSCLPFVSCYCSTFARVHVLEEAIESFLRQDYKGRKELVILNDMPDQELVYDHPEVRIYNVSERILPLGKKFNECVKLCRGDVLCVWDDDDIYLPWRLSFSIERIRDGIFHTKNGLFEENVHLPLKYMNNYFHCNLAYERHIFYNSGGYTEEDLRGTDIQFMERMEVGSQSIEKENIFYIYRWAGTNSYHVSQWSRDSGNIADFTNDYIKKEIRDGSFRRGRIRLFPRWSRDWELLAKNASAPSYSKHISDAFDNEVLQINEAASLSEEILEITMATDTVNLHFKCNMPAVLIFKSVDGRRSNFDIERLISDIYPGKNVKKDVRSILHQFKQMNIAKVVV